MTWIFDAGSRDRTAANAIFGLAVDLITISASPAAPIRALGRSSDTKPTSTAKKLGKLTDTHIAEHWHGDQYQLLDFGDGRKLEQFGAVRLDRACPAAVEVQPADVEQWSSALRIDQRTAADLQKRLPETWHVRHGAICLQLKLTPFGHVGLFPEQCVHWHWLSERGRQLAKVGARPLALNLFGYTGGSTLALAAQGVDVVHVDASSPAVNWAKQNAALSGLQDCTIRWIVDDARKFVERELRRQRRYDIVVLDPPSYGHGPKGQRWDIARDLLPLLENCRQLKPDGAREWTWLLTAHSSSPAAIELARCVQRLCPGANVSHGRNTLDDAAGRALDAGFFVRCIDAS